MFLPPNTTHLWQALDRLFAAWHRVFRKERQEWKDQHGAASLSREGLMECLVSSLGKWTTADTVRAAFITVGWAVIGAVDLTTFPPTHKAFAAALTLREQVRNSCVCS